MDLPKLYDLISLKGKKALVTGAASGIGRATAFRLAEAGADLQLIDINLEGLDTVVEEVSSHSVEAEKFRVDLSSKKEIDNFWNTIKGDEPDILVNNAGIYVFREFLKIEEEFLDRIMRVNL
ncbi:MAG: SDR family NAD(P)-dependent oxidoreductase, partial [Nitrososphaerota archaeon]